ncbi:MAG: histidinol-phosphate transaminase [Rhodospirillales bacterium]|nr:histidinol-phosphate transaminase [Rhodospirillales bacterium]
MGSSLTPKPGIMDINFYVAGESKIPGIERIIKLSSNEGAFGPSEKAIAASQKALSSMHRYPVDGCPNLTPAIAEKHGIDPKQIVVGVGSDEIITLLVRAYAGPGDEVLYSEHGFSMYPIAARSVGATPVTAPEVDLKANVENLLAATTEKTTIVFIANPNNPTGTYLTTDELLRLREGLAPNVLLVVDAAYAEYAQDREDYCAGAELVEKFDNVVMMRTFSKVYGLGGMRVGWGYCPVEIAGVLHRCRNPFNISSASEAAALAALKDEEFLVKSIQHNKTWRDILTQNLRGIGLEVTESLGNFILVQFSGKNGKTADAADIFLKSKGIIVRKVGGYGLPDCLRITIGLEEELRPVMDGLAEFMGTSA